MKCHPNLPLKHPNIENVLDFFDPIKLGKWLKRENFHFFAKNRKNANSTTVENWESMLQNAINLGE